MCTTIMREENVLAMGDRRADVIDSDLAGEATGAEDRRRRIVRSGAPGLE